MYSVSVRFTSFKFSFFKALVRNDMLALILVPPLDNVIPSSSFLTLSCVL